MRSTRPNRKVRAAGQGGHETPEGRPAADEIDKLCSRAIVLRGCCRQCSKTTSSPLIQTTRADVYSQRVAAGEEAFRSLEESRSGVRASPASARTPFIKMQCSVKRKQATSYITYCRTLGRTELFNLNNCMSKSWVKSVGKSSPSCKQFFRLSASLAMHGSML